MPYDSLVSYYPSIEGLDITMGEERITPHRGGSDGERACAE